MKTPDVQVVDPVARHQVLDPLSRLSEILSTLPVVLPFVLFDQAEQALRISNGVALVMLTLLGLGFGHYAGMRRPWLTSLVFTVLGVALVSATITLGG
ncbi:MAG: hypothetical protein ABWY06_11380 [Pseudomonas sp.]|uniref:hypothetical protein n=1 Tax=Pseudomonas sp. TaxID=306 RepID=UPI00339A9043